MMSRQYFKKSFTINYDTYYVLLQYVPRKEKKNVHYKK